MLKLRALAMVVIAVILSVFTGLRTFATTTVPTTAKVLPAVDPAATPAGWVPIAFGNAQVSVPPTWWVLYNSSVCVTGSPVGDVYVNPRGGFCSATGTPKGETAVTLVPLNEKKYQPPSAYGQRQVINGIVVYELYSFSPTANGGTYLVPSRGVEIEAEGPLAKRVVDTLSRSPRAVVLASGPVTTVPSSWRSVRFAGLRFSVPANWPMTQTQVTPGPGAMCRQQGVAFADTTVTLSTDARPPLLAFCPRMTPTPQQPENGVQVDSGLRTEPTVTLSLSPHCLVLHSLTVCPATSPAFSILVMRVNVPERNKPVFFFMGLAGNGTVARTILDSLRPASPSRTTPRPTGVVTGVAEDCEAAQVELLHVKVKASLYSGSKRVASETVVWGTKYRFSVSPGTYRLTGWWGSKAVTVRAGHIVLVSFWNPCI
jgi:hypothetical protein